MLVDSFNRRIRKLRLSLTDRCNFRCHYCMPLEQQFMSEEKYLSITEYKEIAHELKSLGVEEVRLTGGEPLIRKNAAEIISALGEIGFKKLSLTTNAVFLDQYLTVLKEAGVNTINVSLDSLEESNFNRISRGQQFQRVLNNIQRALSAGFQLKINMVVMKGVNSHELLNFVMMAQELNVEVRFLELMRVGHACGEQTKQFMSADEIKNELEGKYTLQKMDDALDSTAQNFKTQTGVKVGFIASESTPFCHNCSRWRLSADGILRACLFKEEGVSLKNLSAKERSIVYQKVLGMKPWQRSTQVTHFMNTIGG